MSSVRSILSAVLFLSAGPVAAHAQQSYTAAAAAGGAGLAGFEGLVGRWAFSDDFVQKNLWAVDFFAEEYDWGPLKSIMRVGETVSKKDPKRRVFEGFAYWHPVENKIKFTGYNIMERFLFEGEYTTMKPNLIVREYAVHYPRDYVFPFLKDVKGQVRVYRDERRLVDDETVEIKTFLKAGAEWRRWPSEAALPFVIKRAPATAPREP